VALKSTGHKFVLPKGPFPLAEIAARVGAELHKPTNSDLLIKDIASLEAAALGDISLLTDAKHVDACRISKASAIITSPKLARLAAIESPMLLAADPRLAFAHAAYLFYPTPAVEPGVHASAQIDPDARVGQGSRIDAGAIIEQSAVLGMRCHIGRNSIIGANVILGDDCHIGSCTSISHAIIGARANIQCNTTIGGPGFGFVPSPNGALRVPQIGRVILGDDVDIGNNCSVDRGALGDTVIGSGSKIDNLVQIGHNVQLGRHCVLASMVGISGSVVVGDFVMMGGRVGIADHIKIGHGARLAAGSGVIQDIADGETVGGYPAVPVRQWHRQTLTLRQRIRGN
jgi:UDP-3-O-[3-hydroxymyristoyl] glucosamine N-acyltransferase